MRRISSIITSGLAIVIISGILSGKVLEVRKKKMTQYQRYVGTEVIINGDTLTITDYGVIEERFYLSNGSYVNYYYVANRNKDY